MSEFSDDRFKKLAGLLTEQLKPSMELSSIIEDTTLELGSKFAAEKLTGKQGTFTRYYNRDRKEVASGTIIDAEVLSGYDGLEVAVRFKFDSDGSVKELPLTTIDLK